MKNSLKIIAGKTSVAYMIFFISAIFVLIVAILFSVHINRMENMMADSIQNHLRSAARAASKLITEDELDLFHTDEDMQKPEWEALRKKLHDFAEEHRVMYVFYMRYLEGSQVQYIIDNDQDEDEMITPDSYIISFENDPELAESVRAFLAGKTWVSDLGAYSASWDYDLITGLAPIRSADGTIHYAAGVDISDEMFLATKSGIQIMRTILFILFCISILSGFMGMLVYRKKVAQNEQRDKLLHAVNRATSVLLTSGDGESFNDSLLDGMEIIGRCVGVDRVEVWRNESIDGELHSILKHIWQSENGFRSRPGADIYNIPYSITPNWEHRFLQGEIIRGAIADLSQADREFYDIWDTKSVLIIPIFMQERFWGWCCFDDCTNTRDFANDEVDILQSVSYMLANAVNRRIMSAEIDEANNRTKLMLDSSPFSCEIWDSNANLIDCNEATVKFFGLKSKEEYLSGYYSFSPEYQPNGNRSDEEVKRVMAKALAEGIHVVEWQHIMLDGTFALVETTLIPMEYGGEPIIIVYNRDLREHNKMMAEIEQRTNELAIQTNTLQTLVNSIPDFVFCKDLSSKYTMINNSLSTFFGVNADDIVGKGDLDGFKFSPEIANHMIAADKKVFESGQRTVDEDSIVVSKSTIYVETIKAPLTKSDGTIIGLVGISRDITEKKKVEEQLKLTLKQAETASKAKSDFLSAMSHEMRTPMNAIIGMTTIGKKSSATEEKNKALDKIEDASSHLLGVINDVLDMAKIEANKLELSPIEYNFERMLQKVISVINFRVEEKKQTLTVNVDCDIPHFVVGDSQRLAQVITNLLSNAVKFTPEGGKIHLEAHLVSKVGEDCELCIIVSDTGIGISAEQQEKLFRPFEQAESGTSRKYGGTGLGLVISKRIVELMGGSIRVESELEKGTKFIVTVKTKRGENKINSLLSLGVNWQTVRILAVDDVPQIREQFQNIFGQLNIRCDVAVDGLDACRLIEEQGGYDIYFVDWYMSNMDGIELTRQIKSYEDNKPCVVIMITAMDWEQIKDEAAQAGVDRYLLKPLFTSTVIDCVNDCFGTAIIRDEDISVVGEFTGKRLLMAEDVEINCEILISLLADTGLIIDCVENGQEAVDTLTANPDKYDLVFMDIQMPIMDGYEATRRIRESGFKLPIIALTANVFKEDIKACIDAGMNGHLGKPFDIDKVIEMLKKYLKTGENL